MLLLRRIVREEAGLYRADPAEWILLEYYANSIERLVAAAGMPPVAVAPAAA